MNNPSWHEQAMVFECDVDRLIGIVNYPKRSIETGVVIIVGGPQYRAGSHRQFTLLARQLAEQGIASFRFDYRGMGDSEGDMRTFEEIDGDIKASIDTFMTQAPNIKRVILWGLCDAASAALYYGHTDPRVKGLVLLNPWVHSEAGAARARFKHYYLNRLFSKSFWAKLLTGQVRLGASLGELANSARHAGASKELDNAIPTDPRHGSPGYINRMLRGLKKFDGKVQIILSGNDLTAQEFSALIKQDSTWRKAVANKNISTQEIKAANHTFASKAWRDQVGITTRKLVSLIQDD